MQLSRAPARFGLCLALLSCSLAQAGPIPTGKPSAYPDWWFEQDVIARLPAHAGNPSPIWPDHYPASNDFAVANIGQLKLIASKAAVAFDARTVAGAGDSIDALVASWSQAPAQGVQREDYSALNRGQLKQVSRLFYQRFAQLGLDSDLATQPYAWSLSAPGNDWGAVNLGQLKHVFSFSLTAHDWTGDDDHDLMANSWETTHLGGTSATASGDADSDGLSNLTEYLLYQLSANPQPSSVATAATHQATGLVVYSP